MAWGEHRCIGSKGRTWWQAGWGGVRKERSRVNHCVPARADEQIGEALSFFSVFLRQDVAWAELTTSSTSPSLTG